MRVVGEAIVPADQDADAAFLHLWNDLLHQFDARDSPHLFRRPPQFIVIG